MALQFSTFTKNKILSNFLSNNSSLTNSYMHTNASFRVFPSTVAFPSSGITFASIPAGHILTIGTGMSFSIVNNIINITSGPTSGNTTAAGTLSWWALGVMSGTNQLLISDSIGTSGSGSVLTVNTLTPTSGQSVSITFNLRMV